MHPPPLGKEDCTSTSRPKTGLRRRLISSFMLFWQAWFANVAELSGRFFQSFEIPFESGIAFSKGSPIKETTSLACVTASEETNFSEMKAVLQSLLRIGFNIKCETKTLSKHTLFSQGRVAEIVANKKTVGYIGELDSKVLENFRIRTKVVGFEIKLSGLIFD